MEGEKKHYEVTQHEIDQYLENAPIENESDYPELKRMREDDQRLFEQAYPDDKSRYEGALGYLSGDFVQVLWLVEPPTPEEGIEGWQRIHAVETVEAHYSQHPRYPLYAPILLKYAPQEVSEQNHLVHKMNEAIRQRNAEEINKIKEEATAFRERIFQKSAESREKYIT